MENKIILISHGNLAKGMQNSVNMIIGNTNNCVNFGLQPGVDNNTIANEVKDYMKKNGKNIYIIVADLLGGSVSNSVTDLCELNDIYLINGMNSGMVIALLLEKSLLDATKINQIVEEAKKGIGLMSFDNDSIMGESEIQ